MYKISFIYEGNLVEFKNTNLKNLYTSSLDWLNKNGYTFKGEVHSTFNRRIHSIDEVRKMIGVYQMSHFYNIDNSGKYILYNDISINKILPNILNMLKNFGIGESTIKTEGFETYSRIKKFGEIENDLESKDFIETKSKKMTFLVACQFVLKQNDNRPMNAKEIWEEINKQNLKKTNGLTPWDTVNAKMILSSINTTAKGKKKNSIFQIIEGTKPYKFILLNPDNIQDVPDEDEIQDVPDVDMNYMEIESEDGIKPFTRMFPSNFKASQAQEERPMQDIKKFKKFKAIQAQEEREDFFNYSKNPFSQAMCVLGESGAGKSTTIDNILKKSGHVYQYIIPSASTTGLLSQFSTSVGSSGGYVASRLGQMIEKAYNNKDVNYTAVFDECHKTSIIEMINDELLQAISKNRNKGVRFISLDDDTRKLYPSAKEDSRGNVLIPDNFGFIFISSNVRVISGNPDFFNRVDLIELTVEDRKLQSIEDLNQKRVIGREDKKELVNQIKSKKDD